MAVNTLDRSMAAQAKEKAKELPQTRVISQDFKDGMSMSKQVMNSVLKVNGKIHHL